MERIIIIALIFLWFSVTFFIGILMETVAARMKAHKKSTGGTRTRENIIRVSASDGIITKGLQQKDKLSLDRNEFLCYNHSNI